MADHPPRCPRPPAAARADAVGVRPSPAVLAMGVCVDAVHSVTALALAGADRDRGRPGLLDAAVAASWAIAGYCDLVQRKHTERRRQQTVSEYREPGDMGSESLRALARIVLHITTVAVGAKAWRRG